MKYIPLLSFILFLVSFWQRNDFSEDRPPVNSALLQEPLQTPTDKAAFAVTAGDIRYQIQPLYEYDLYGLIVSYRHHDGDYALHKLWNDHLNVADVCVVWQQNATDAHLHHLDFWNGQFTCNVKTSNQAAWDSFQMNQLSNNHLLSVDNAVRDKLNDIRIGDQIHIKGWLASYTNDQGGSRGSSTTRDDTGNGACETIFVQSVDILSQYHNRWRALMVLSLLVFIVSLVIHFRAKPRWRL